MESRLATGTTRINIKLHQSPASVEAQPYHEMRTRVLLLVYFFLFQVVTSRKFSGIKRRNRGELPKDGESDLSAAASRGHIGFVSSRRLVDKIFDGADTNKDGTVNFYEVYELVLKFYISINQQAPIPPPSKKRVLQLFLNADTSHDNRLNREEFHGLANILARRAVTRVAAHKLLTLVGAPLLAEYLIRKFTGVSIMPKIAEALVPDRYEEKVMPVVTSPAFCRTLLIIVLVATLGNVVMNMVNKILDLRLGDEDKDERLKDIGKLYA